MRLGSGGGIFEYKKNPRADPGAQGGQATQGDKGAPGDQEGGVHEERVTDSESDAEGGQPEKVIPAENTNKNK